MMMHKTLSKPTTTEGNEFQLQSKKVNTICYLISNIISRTKSLKKPYYNIYFNYK